jgi:hypothetical protein
MITRTRVKRVLFSTLAGAGLLTGSLLLSGGAPASASGQSPAGTHTTPVPPELAPPAGQALVGVFAARGVQVYQCTGGVWVFVEPAANLVGWAGHRGTVRTAVHFRGPSWESTDDGSLVTGAAIASVPVTGSIPQLLLRAASNRGDGVFGAVTYVQRLATSGGAAPAGGCAEGQSTGVPYRAEYRFYAAG